MYQFCDVGTSTGVITRLFASVLFDCFLSLSLLCLAGGAGHGGLAKVQPGDMMHCLAMEGWIPFPQPSQCWSDQEIVHQVKTIESTSGGA